MHDSNHLEEKRKIILSHRHKTQLHFSLMYCNRNTPVTGHKQGNISFLKRKTLSSSTVNSTHTICSKDLQESGPCLQRYKVEFNPQSLCEKVIFMWFSLWVYGIWRRMLGWRVSRNFRWCGKIVCRPTCSVITKLCCSN